MRLTMYMSVKAHEVPGNAPGEPEACAQNDEWFVH